MTLKSLVIVALVGLGIQAVSFGQESSPTTQEITSPGGSLVLSVTFVAIIINVGSRIQSDVRGFVSSRRDALAHGTPIPRFDWPTFAGQIIDGFISGLMTGLLGGSIGSTIATS